MKISAALTVGFIMIGLVLIGLAFMPDPPPPQLEFPISETESIEGLAAYHTPDWGEPGVYHNGIDLIVTTNVSIVSPTDGHVTIVTEQVNPYAGNILFSIEISISLVWAVKLVLEPGFRDDANNSLQTEAILVSPNDIVSTGDKIATLLYSQNYCHLHYMALYRGSDVSAYDYSSPAAKTIFEDIAIRSNSTIQYDYEPPSSLQTPYFYITSGLGFGFILISMVLYWRIRQS